MSDLRHIGEDSGWTTLLDYEYDNFSLDDYGVDILKQQCKQCQDNLKTACEEKSHPFMADDTLDRSESEMWMFYRQWKITASNCKDVVCLKNGHTGLVKRLLWTSSPFTPAVFFMGERINLKQLSNTWKKIPILSLKKTGLWLNPAYPQLGCSPDGLINDNQSGLEGLNKIKCPYVLKHCDPNDVNKCKNALTKKELNNFFCTIENGKHLLKWNHKYYYQVQMQVGICEKSVRDFIVWSPIGMSVERVNWSDILEKYIFKVGVISERVRSTWILPYFLMRIPRDTKRIRNL